MSNYKLRSEIILGLYSEGQCVAESSLFSENTYIGDGVAMDDCTVLRLESFKFYELLEANLHILWRILQDTSERLRYNYIMKLASANPTNKLLTLFNYLKTNHYRSRPYSYAVPYTRKDIASLLGLRVETVRRTVKKMERDKRLKIKSGKIFY